MFEAEITLVAEIVGKLDLLHLRVRLLRRGSLYTFDETYLAEDDVLDTDAPVLVFVCIHLSTCHKQTAFCHH